MLIFQSKSNFIWINLNESNIAVSESLSPWNVSEKKGWQNMAQNFSQYSFWFGINIPFSALSQFNSNWNRHRNSERNRIQHRKFRRIQPQKLESNNKLNYSTLSSCVHAQEHRRRCYCIVHTYRIEQMRFSATIEKTKRSASGSFHFSEMQSIRKWFFDQWKREHQTINGTYYLLITISPHWKCMFCGLISSIRR